MMTPASTNGSRWQSGRLGRLLSTVAPILIVACPAAVFGQVAVNTARVAVGADTFEADLTNNQAVESDAVLAVLAANADLAGPVNGANGGSNVLDVLANDSLNAIGATIANVTILVVTPASNPGVTLDIATGLISVMRGVPAGTYTITYQICEIENPTNCAIAIATIIVEAPAILAADDAPPAVDGAVGADDIVNAFDNDSLNDAPIVVSAITATVTSPAQSIDGRPVPSLDPATGLVDVPVGTPAGTYTIGYRICENNNPANCADATVTVIVTATVITASDDNYGPLRSGIGNANVGNILENDALNGVVPTPENVTISVVAPASNPGVVLDPATGNISVSPQVPAGTYTISYQICETLNPANCAQSTVTVVVEPALGSIAGTVYEDGNVNRQLDSEEVRREGWLIEVIFEGEIVATARSDAQGNYQIDGLLSASGYSIRFTNPDNGVVYRVITGVSLPENALVSDQNLPIDPSGVVYDSVTRAPVGNVVISLLGANGIALPATCFLAPSQQNQTTDTRGNYRFDLVPGASPQCPVGETIYTIAIAPPGNYSAPSTVLPAEIGAFDPTGLTAPVMIGSSANAPANGELVRWYQSFRLAAGDPDVVFNHIPIDPFTSRNPLIVSKTSTRRTAGVGDLVPYTITVRNPEAVQRAGVDVVDILPPGFKYVTGSAAIDGTPVEPVLNDRELRWNRQVIPANSTVTYNLIAVVGAGVTVGDRINNGLARNGGDGSEISNRGQAVISIVPSAIFDCSEVIGKVFDDRNGNGYQDQGEPGIPGARLATVNGELITTDEFGRYHIACASVPDAQIGSNYVLKLDLRTVAQGYWPTSDNPQSIRLTRGKISELNFGVQRAATIGLDVDTRAFLQGSATPSPEFAQKLASLRSDGTRRPIIQINYQAADAEDWTLAERRVAAIKAAVEALFAADDKTAQPTIEANVSRAASAPGRE